MRLMDWTTRQARRAWEFITMGLWTLDLGASHPTIRFLYRSLRVSVLAARGFFSTRARNRAAALTLTTMLSIAPLLAASFAIAKGLGYKDLRPAILRAVNLTDEDVRTNATSAELRKQVDMVLNYVEATNMTALGTIGLVVLFFTVASLLYKIEYAFNEIWGIDRGRPILRRLSDYTSVLVVCPLLVVLATAVMAPLSSGDAVERIASWIRPLLLGGGERFAEIAASVIVYGVGMLVGYVIMISAFTFLYLFVPNTRVRFLSALTAGVVAALLWQIVQYGYMRSQVGLARYNAIYATFASFPIFLIWLHVGWQIVLFGAELSFAHQNESQGRVLPFVEEVAFQWRASVALRLMLSIGRAFVEGRPPVSVRQMSEELLLPPRIVGQILNDLKGHGLVVEAAAAERAFVPGRSLDTVTFQEVLDALRHVGEGRIPLKDDPAMLYVKARLQGSQEAEGRILKAVTLRQAIDEAWA